MAQRKPNIGILETGRVPDKLTPDFGDYPSMVKRWMSPFDATFKSFPVLDGILPDAPEVCDFWVITGSKFSAYENHPWIGQLEDFIRACRDAKSKMIGICFGHQMIAQALGGTVVKSDKGWGLGVHRYSTARWPDTLAPAPADLRLQAFHQDQVIRAPAGAMTIAGSDFCEYGALWYPGFALTVQGHPEMPKSYARALLDLRREQSGEISADTAMTDTGCDTNRAALALFIRDHLNVI